MKSSLVFSSNFTQTLDLNVAFRLDFTKYFHLDLNAQEFMYRYIFLVTCPTQNNDLSHCPCIVVLISHTRLNWLFSHIPEFYAKLSAWLHQYWLVFIKF